MDQWNSESMVKVENLKEPKTFLKKKDKDEVRSEQATDYLFKGLVILGINPPERLKISYIIYSVIVNLGSTVYVPLSFTISCVLMTRTSFEISAFLTSAYVNIEVWGCSLKVITIAFMVKQLKACNAIASKMDQRCKEPDEIEELRALRTRGRQYFILFSTAFFSYATTTVVASLIKGEPAFSIYIPFIDWHRSREEQRFATVFEYVLMYISCFQEAVNDSYGVIYVGILRTHLKLLKMRIRKLGKNRECTSDESLDQLKLCIIDHKNYIELFSNIAPVMAVTLFIQFTITAILVGSTLINMLIFIEGVADQTSAACFLFSVIVQAAPICYHAQCLIEENTSLSDEIIYCHWVDQDSRFRKMLVYFIQQAQQPMLITAGKIIPINLDTMLRIGKFSFTLYTFIDQLNIKERLNA